ncbi:MORN repeat-containing protein 5-like [Trichoplusia ni]|uniref:MORN repeat-containing protein 5 n=1 Tax=Trichoplusia ni TaxID=7111 RepID=A0A7E5WSV3_TRINI|nr:MORN repeat-containing protein 5-like [Trichoplusia ni]
MTSSRKMSMASNCISEKRISQWEDLMRKFSDSHKTECRTAPLDIPRAPRSTKFFPTGSQYEGTWDILGMSGYGDYVFPNGVEYGGDFEDGMFHGKGELRYQDGAVIRGKFDKGVMTERLLSFTDTLEYNESDWKYCVMPDRRFAIEYDLDVAAAGISYLTADQPTKEIPPGHYDSGDGFYNAKTRSVFKYEDPTRIVRSASEREHKWILENCRRNPDDPLGPRPDLYEKWSEPIDRLQPPPPPAAGPKTNISGFRAQSIFEQDFDFFKGFKFFRTGSSSESSTNTSD